MYKCIAYSGGVDVSVNRSAFFTFRRSTHNLIDSGNNQVRVSRKIDGLFEFLDTPVTDFVDVTGSPIAYNYADLLAYFIKDRTVLAGEGIAVDNGTVSVVAGGPSTLGGFKVGTGLTVDGSGRLSASATSEVTRVLNTEAEMLALPVEELRSYRVIRLDTKRLYYLNASTSASVLANWFVGPSIEASVLSFNGRTGAVEGEFGDYNFDLVPMVDKANSTNFTLVVEEGRLYIQNMTTTDLVEISYSSVGSELGARTTALEDLVSSPTGLNAKVTQLLTEVARNTDSIENTQAGLKTRVKALEDKPVVDYSPQITELESKNSSQDTLITAIDGKADSVAANNVVLDTRVSTLEERPLAVDYSTDITAIKAKNTTQDTKLTELDGAILNKANLVNGKIPYDQLPEFPVGRKVNVANQATRFSLSRYADLTIAYQSDTGDAWGLDANADPAISANWSKLGNAQGIGVASFNGRTGQIGAMVGDYDAGKITELVEKRFVTTDQIAKWNASSEAAGVTTFKGRSGTVIPTTGDYSADLITETATRKFATNEQVTSWNGKETTSGSQAKADAVKTYSDTTFLTKVQRGSVNGVASLDASGKIPSSQILTNVTGGFATLNSFVKVPTVYLPTNTPNGVPLLGADSKIISDNMRITRSRYFNVKPSRVASSWYSNTTIFDMTVRIVTPTVNGGGASSIEIREGTTGTVMKLTSYRVASNIVNSQWIEVLIPAGFQYRYINGNADRLTPEEWYEIRQEFV